MQASTTIAMRLWMGLIRTDVDEDGSTCDAVPDCDDRNPDINPGADEVCDEIDNDCDSVIDGPSAVDATVYFEDTDDDGYGVSFSTPGECSLPDGWSANGDDCDDNRADVSPEGTEVCGDGIDNDCDWAIDGDDTEMDSDEDGFTLCDEVPDCDDGNPDINPDADEVCDGVDNDCMVRRTSPAHRMAVWPMRTPILIDMVTRIPRWWCVPCHLGTSRTTSTAMIETPRLTRLPPKSVTAWTTTVTMRPMKRVLWVFRLTSWMMTTAMVTLNFRPEL